MPAPVRAKETELPPTLVSLWPLTCNPSTAGLIDHEALPPRVAGPVKITFPVIPPGSDPELMIEPAPPTPEPETTDRFADHISAQIEGGAVVDRSALQRVARSGRAAGLECSHFVGQRHGEGIRTGQFGDARPLFCDAATAGDGALNNLMTGSIKGDSAEVPNISCAERAVRGGAVAELDQACVAS